MEERARRAGRRAAVGRRRERARGGAGVCRLRRCAARVPGGRLRRPDRAARSRCSNPTPRRAHAGRRAARTCWSTNTRTPTRRSTGCFVIWSATRRHSPQWATTTRRSTAGAARRSTTWRSCRCDYPALRVIKLEQNYRSTVRILRCANALIGNNHEALRQALVDRARARRPAAGHARRRRGGRSRARRAPARRTQVRAPRRDFATTPSSIAATTRRAFSRRHFARRRFRTTFPAASRCSSAPRSRTSSRTCA